MWAFSYVRGTLVGPVRQTLEPLAGESQDLEARAEKLKKQLDILYRGASPTSKRNPLRGESMWSVIDFHTIRT